MIWPSSFQDKLKSWYDLRVRCAGYPVEQALWEINNWWWFAPMINRAIDWADWPDPWQLLSKPALCDLARSVGMLYTVIMIFDDRLPTRLIQTKDNNLVLVDTEKYILNWSPDMIVNIRSPRPKEIVREIAASEFERLIG